MQVIVDARMAFHGGIGRYIRSVCRAMVQQDASLRLVLHVDPRTADELRQAIGPATLVPFPAAIYSISEQLHSFRWHRAEARQAALLHFPHYNVPWHLPGNSVVTIHDLTHFQFPQYFGRLRVKLAFRLLQRAVRRAGQIITVSQATRHALEKLLPEAKGKTSVIYHGVEEHFVPLPVTQREEVKRDTRLGRFVLYVGNNKPHKNLVQLVRAFTQVRGLGHDIQLVLLGVTPSAALPPLEGVHMLPAVTDAQLVHWYNAADICVLPSLNEGFGFSALEAMACGTPVIAANVASLPEVIGTAGVLVSPYNKQDLADAIGRLLSDPDLRCHLRELGFKQARRFSWATAAQQTLQVYRQVAG